MAHHLTFEDRLQIEVLLRAGHSKKEIAQLIGCSLATIYNDLHRGMTTYITTDLVYYAGYSAQRAHDLVSRRRSKCGRALSLGHDYDLAYFIQYCLVYLKWSPSAISAWLRSHQDVFTVSPCRSTIENWIRAGYLGGVSLRPVKKRIRTYKQPKMVVPLDRSIRSRPHEADIRMPGHWELDTVVGSNAKKASSVNSKSCLLVATERSSRFEIIRKLPDRSSASVAKALHDMLQTEPSFRPLSITSDNGTEFRSEACFAAVPCSWYFADPYRSSQRGSNENANRLIRRWFPKGSTFDAVSPARIQELQRWMNELPRKIHGFRTAAQVAQEERPKSDRLRQCAHLASPV